MRQVKRRVRINLDTMLAALPHRRGQGPDDECWEWLGSRWVRPAATRQATTPLRAVWSRYYQRQLPRKAALDPRPNCHPLCVRPSHRTLRLMLPTGMSLTSELRKFLRDQLRDGVNEATPMVRLDVVVVP